MVNANGGYGNDTRGSRDMGSTVLGGTSLRHENFFLFRFLGLAFFLALDAVLLSLF